jgi:copper oxidase (laccase) domain-containing protein
MKDLNHLIEVENIRIFVSEKKDCSMRLSGDFKDEKIIGNRKKFFKKNGINFKDVVSADLVHGSNVRIVDIKDKGRIIKKTDGLVTKERNIFLTVTVADCLPIFLYVKNERGRL